MSLRKSFDLLMSDVSLAMSRGASISDRARLFYHLKVKPALVGRNMARWSPETIRSFAFKANKKNDLTLFARDNGTDIAAFREFFAPDCKFAVPTVRPFEPKVIYDLGASIGMASLYFQSLYPTARMYGFEPAPASFEMCTMNYRGLNGKVLPWAVGQRSETTMSVSDAIEVHKLEPPDFLKIDVEGAEMEVLHGLGRHADGIRRIFIETHGDDLHRRCLLWLKERQFRFTPSQDPTAIWADRG